MIRYISILLILFLLSSCTSFKDNVIENKVKFIQVGIENSRSVDENNLESLLTTAKENSTEAKIKYLKVDKLETLYQDSVVLFINGNELAIYDFASAERETETIKTNLKLSSVEIIDKRLFLGKR